METYLNKTMLVVISTHIIVYTVGVILYMNSSTLKVTACRPLHASALIGVQELCEHYKRWQVAQRLKL